MSNDSQLNLGKLGQISMLCRSTDETEAWYRDVLKLPEIFRFGELVFFDCGGTRLYFNQVPTAEWRKGSMLYFLVADISAAVAKLGERGIQFQGAAAHDLQGRRHGRGGMDDVLRRSGREHVGAHVAGHTGRLTQTW